MPSDYISFVLNGYRTIFIILAPFKPKDKHNTLSKIPLLHFPQIQKTIFTKNLASPFKTVFSVFILWEIPHGKYV